MCFGRGCSTTGSLCHSVRPAIVTGQNAELGVGFVYCRKPKQAIPYRQTIGLVRPGHLTWWAQDRQSTEISGEDALVDLAIAFAVAPNRVAIAEKETCALPIEAQQYGIACGDLPHVEIAAMRPVMDGQDGAPSRPQ